MAANASFKEFCRAVGFVPLREAWSEAFALIALFLVIYGIFLVIVLPVGWIARTTIGLFGIPERAIGYAVASLYLVWLFKNRKTVFAQLADTFGFLKEAPKFYRTLFIAALIAGIVSLKWLPLWLAFGVWLALDFVLAFLDKMHQLGRKYAPLNAGAAVEDQAV